MNGNTLTLDKKRKYHFCAMLFKSKNTVYLDGTFESNVDPKDPDFLNISREFISGLFRPKANPKKVNITSLTFLCEMSSKPS